MRARFFLFGLLTFGLVLLVWRLLPVRRPSSVATAPAKPAEWSQGSPEQRSRASRDSSPTKVYAHNLLLRKGPNFRVYVRWLRGQMAPTRRNVTPSFDDPESFVLDIRTGVLRANVGDIANYLNTGLENAPLKNIKLSGDGDHIKLTGTLRKIVSLPIELDGTIAPGENNLIRVHITKLNVLKVPFKALLGTFRVTLSDLFQAKDIPGVTIAGNDIAFDTQQLLPPPHIRGHLTKVHIVNPDLEEVFGDAQEDVERVEEWRNFLRLRDGSIDFGKLTMHNVDLIMIDLSKDPWFDLDLANYQKQLVNGYTRMTPQAGLQIFMPDRRDLPPDQANRNISIEWFKNRNLPVPNDVRRR